MALLAGCSGKKETPQQRYDAAKALFEQTTKTLHLPSAEANGVERERLQEQAAQNYGQLLRQYPEQTNWCAQALLSLGHIRAAQTNVSTAVKHYAAVGEKYPGADWEILQAWKSAGDLLWDANQHPAAKKFYQQIAARFDGTNQPSVVRIAVRGARSRLAE